VPYQVYHIFRAVPWAVSDEVWQNVRAAVAGGGGFTLTKFELFTL